MSETFEEWARRVDRTRHKRAQKRRKDAYRKT